MIINISIVNFVNKHLCNKTIVLILSYTFLIKNLIDICKIRTSYRI
jgi:hypothetical protein